MNPAPSVNSRDTVYIRTHLRYWQRIQNVYAFSSKHRRRCRSCASRRVYPQFNYRDGAIANDVESTVSRCNNEKRSIRSLNSDPPLLPGVSAAIKFWPASVCRRIDRLTGARDALFSMHTERFLPISPSRVMLLEPGRSLFRSFPFVKNSSIFTEPFSILYIS